MVTWVSIIEDDLCNLTDLVLSCWSVKNMEVFVLCVVVGNLGVPHYVVVPLGVGIHIHSYEMGMSNCNKKIIYFIRQTNCMTSVLVWKYTIDKKGRQTKLT